MTIDDWIRTLRQPSATKVRTAVVSLLTDMRNEFAEPRVRALIAKRIESLDIAPKKRSQLERLERCEETLRMRQR